MNGEVAEPATTGMVQIKRHRGKGGVVSRFCSFY
jgi:hypothetical protein